ncbi:MAG: phosphatase PAP2 family protein [Sakamotonia sp.]|jgi:membrane-associated phospholipid phosphatase
MAQMELAVLDLIQEFFRNPFMDSLMPAVTRLGDAGFFWILLGLVLFCSRKYRRTGAAVLLSLAADLVICNLFLKNMAARVRPCDLNPAVQLLIARPSDFSFPSGHTAAAFTAVFSLYRENNRLWKPVLVLASVIAFSRMYLYVHFPTDVLGGVAVGWVCALAGQALSGRLLPPEKEVY